MKLQVRLVTNTTVLDFWREQAQRHPALVKSRFRRIARPVMKSLLKRLRIVPPKQTGNIDWTSNRQQRAFHLSDGFGGGIPHERTDAYIDAFDVQLIQLDLSGFIQITNDHPAHVWIGGNGQQEFLADRGWQRYLDVIEEEERPATDLLIDQYLLLAEGATEFT